MSMNKIKLGWYVSPTGKRMALVTSVPTYYPAQYKPQPRYRISHGKPIFDLTNVFDKKRAEQYLKNYKYLGNTREPSELIEPTFIYPNKTFFNRRKVMLEQARNKKSKK